MIKIKAKDGTMREAESMDGLQPGETAIIEPEISEEDLTDGELLRRMAAFFGVRVSDFIEAAAHAFGIPPCAACQMTKQVLYSIKHLGVMRSTVLLMRIFAVRFGAVEAERIERELNTALQSDGVR